MAVVAMKAVMVSIGLRGSSEVVGTCPAAIRTIIVSPTAREPASTIEATMPDMAAGTITRVAVFDLVAPRPNEASRRPWGTDRMASSEIEAMIGTIIEPDGQAGDAGGERRLN